MRLAGPHRGSVGWILIVGRWMGILIAVRWGSSLWVGGEGDSYCGSVGGGGVLIAGRWWEGR